MIVVAVALLAYVLRHSNRALRRLAYGLLAGAAVSLIVSHDVVWSWLVMAGAVLIYADYLKEKTAP